MSEQRAYMLPTGAAEGLEADYIVCLLLFALLPLAPVINY